MESNFYVCFIIDRNQINGRPLIYNTLI